MRFTATPHGCAGADQVNALEESIQSQIEEMFTQVAKRRSVEYGVGRTAMTGSGADIQRLEAQKRECDGSTVFHAGRAMELALHLLYARGTDRILGRDYPSAADPKQIRKDRQGHGLAKLYRRIVGEFDGRNMKDALEHVYQKALHRGLVDIRVDGERVGTFCRPEDLPFRETATSRISDGTEMTLDHGGIDGLISPQRGSELSEMREDTFENFLTKADQSYYERDMAKRRDDMRWAHYGARDHEPGRPYVVIGSEFFARLVKGIVHLSHQRWTWNQEFAQRWYQHRQYNAMETMKALAQQHLSERVELPEPMPIDEAMRVLGGVGEPARHAPRGGYDYLHSALEFESKGEAPGAEQHDHGTPDTPNTACNTTTDINQTQEDCNMREGFYKVDYAGAWGLGFAVLVFDSGVVVGADAMGGTYDGTYEWNPVTSQLDVQVQVKIPAGVTVVQGQVAPEGGLTFSASCSFSREARNEIVKATTELGDVHVAIDLLRAF